MRKISLVLAVTGVLAAGCADVPRDLTRDEYLAMVSRTYENVTAEDAIAAAEQVLRLSDADFGFRHLEDGFEASRNWLVYAIFAGSTGTDTWTVSATPVTSGVKVEVRISRTSAAGIIPVPMGTFQVELPVVYDFFWGQLDWMLGARADWPLCPDSGESQDLLCGVTTENRTPGEEERTIARGT